MLVAPRSFASLEDDTFGVGRGVSLSNNCHSERSEESHLPPRFLLAQKAICLLRRRDNQACVSLCLHKRGTRRLLCSQKIYDFLRCESAESGRFQRAKSICSPRGERDIFSQSEKVICSLCERGKIFAVSGAGVCLKAKAICLLLRRDMLAMLASLWEGGGPH